MTEQEREACKAELRQIKEQLKPALLRCEKARRAWVVADNEACAANHRMIAGMRVMRDAFVKWSLADRQISNMQARKCELEEELRKTNLTVEQFKNYQTEIQQIEDQFYLALLERQKAKRNLAVTDIETLVIEKKYMATREARSAALTEWDAANLQVFNMKARRRELKTLIKTGKIPKRLADITQGMMKTLYDRALACSKFETVADRERGNRSESFPESVEGGN